MVFEGMLYFEDIFILNTFNKKSAEKGKKAKYNIYKRCRENQPDLGLVKVLCTVSK